MDSDSRKENELKPTIDNLSQAIFTVNKHAKTAINPQFLYQLKKTAIEKMIRENKAEKTGLHYSRNPKFSQQQSDVSVQCGNYIFHIPPTKSDFAQLPHLGHLDQQFRNPKTRMSLNTAKRLLQEYTGRHEKKNAANKKGPQKPVFKKLGESFF